MKEYLSALLGVCVISAVVKAVASDGAMKKYVEMLCTLCVLAVLIMPVSDIISSSYGFDGLLEKTEFEGENYEDVYNEYISEKEIDRAEKLLTAELAEYLEIDAEALRVKLEVSYGENGETDVEKAKVYLGMQAVGISPEAVTEYLYGRIGAECQIIYGITDEK